MIGRSAAGSAPSHGKAAVSASPQLAANAIRAAAGAASIPMWTDVYTVMMKNLPNKVTQQLLLSVVNEAGFSHAYDFLHLPIDPDTMANRGYAFLNFVNTEWALKFHAHFEGKQFSNFNSSKIISVVPAAVQGYKANHEYYSSVRVRLRDPASRPLFLRGPVNEDPQVQCRPKSLIDLAAEQRLEQQMRTQDEQEVRAAPQRPGTEFSAAAFASACQYIASMTGINADLVLTEATRLKEAAKPAEPNEYDHERAFGGGWAGGEVVSSTTARPLRPSEPPKTREAPMRIPKFCPYCGGKHEPSFKFCRYCGAEIGTQY
jgi:hypothetical protein